MLAHVLAVALVAAPGPGVEKARSLSAQKSWEELYLAYSAANPTGYSAKDRKELAAALLKGAQALQESDAVMAYSLAERAVAFEESAPALLALARSAKAIDQKSSAEEALRKGVKQFPAEGAFGLELGQLLLDEQDAAGAVQALKTVTKKSPQFSKAQALLQKANAQLSEEAQARSEATKIEKRMNGGEVTQEPVRTAVAEGEGEVQPTSLTYESSAGPNGLRTRQNSRFRFRYFNNERDFGQRAEYEGRVSSALDEAYGFAQRILGVTRSKPLDVILYTREEFAIHQGAAAANQIAGLYSMGAIRMNDSAEINPSTKATLVHEYVHSVIDDAASDNSHALPTWLNEGVAEYVEWRYLGGDGPPLVMRKHLESAVSAEQVPHLQQMGGGMLVQLPDPGAAYAYSAVAVKLMLKNGGTENFMGLVREVGAGTPFEQAFEARYGRTIEALDRDTRSELSRR